MTGVLDFIERLTPTAPRLLRAFDFLLPALVFAVLVLGIVQVGNVSAIANDNRSNLQAQEAERTDRISATNSLDEYFCGQVEDIKGAIEGILNATLAVPPRVPLTPQQEEIRQVIAGRLSRLESGGACKVRIPPPPGASAARR